MNPVYNILTFGAVPDTDALQTAAIQAALDRAKETGGTVVIPADTFVTGGLHDMVSFMEYFASPLYPLAGANDIVFRDCLIENPGQILEYDYTHSTFTGCHFNAGNPLRHLTLENVWIRGLKKACTPIADPEAPLTVVLKNVFCTDENGVPCRVFSAESENISVREE